MAARTALLGALACAFLSHALAFSSFSPVAYPRPLFLQRHEGKPTCNRLAAEPRLRSTLRPLRCESTKSGVRAQMTDLLRLEAELEEAVLLENYSEAAALRDKIANLRTDSSLSVLAVNEAFYKAFRNGDSEAMDKVWHRGDGDDKMVTCSHPGMPPLIGREAVMEGWNAILAGGPPQIQADDIHVAVHGDAAWVCCREDLGGASCSATNIFVRNTQGTWGLAHHAATPVMGLF
ncbi:hypothetical protein T484DRAFT_1969635 [Baffinella frigidus]|nr:hypothetical protein T484DRAFT_1969635 [Cryptophyta sp. CCMP2293]